MPEKDPTTGIEGLGLEPIDQDFEFIKKGSSHIFGEKEGAYGRLKIIGLATAIVCALILIFFMFGTSGNKSEKKALEAAEDLKGKISEIDEMASKIQRLEKTLEELQRANRELAKETERLSKELSALSTQRQEVKKETPLPQKALQQAAQRPEPRFHVVKKGETLQLIAKKYGISYKELVKINQIKDPNKVVPGQKLRLSP